MTKNLWCICRDVFKSSVHKREWLISWLTKLVWNVLNIMQLRITLRSTSSIDILIHLYKCAYITHTCKPLLSAVTLAGNIIYIRRFFKCEDSTNCNLNPGPFAFGRAKVLHEIATCGIAKEDSRVL